MLPFALSLNTDLTGTNRTNFATFYGITGATSSPTPRGARASWTR